MTTTQAKIYCKRCGREIRLPGGRRPPGLRCHNCGFVFPLSSEAFQKPVPASPRVKPSKGTPPATPSPRRRLIVPEVVQTSAMDCGPASLKSLLEGFDISVSYERLRQACQTDVDGTSIDTMEELAVELGLDAEQIMVPLDHLLLAEAQALPAIVVVRQPNGCTHFVVAWRRHGRYLQIMDPAVGRCWIPCLKFLEELYVHRMPVPADTWREWAGSSEFLSPLRRRLADLGVRGTIADQLVSGALADTGWLSLAAVDATTRMVEALVRSGGLRRGRETCRVIETLIAEAKATPAGDDKEPYPVPAVYWSARALSSAPAESGESLDSDPSDEGQLLLRGVVLVRARDAKKASSRKGGARTEKERPSAGPLRPELAAALTETPARPGRELLRMVCADGLRAPSFLAGALAIASSGILVEALLFRALFDLGRDLGLSGQRLGAMSAVVLFASALLLLELPTMTTLLRLGRHLEGRLRIAFLEKLPRLSDRYFQSRLTSDMADRSHVVSHLRLLPELGGDLARVFFELVLTVAGIVWLDPRSAPLALLAGLVAVAVPLLAQPVLTERDLRFRTHAGALSRFYLDSLLGLVPVRTHGAEGAVRREHESLLVEWVRAGMGLQRAVVAFEGVHAALGLGLAIALLLRHLGTSEEGGLVLLLLYWALNLPVLGRELAALAWRYPSYRNVTLRLLEPLGAPEQAIEAGSAAETKDNSSSRGVAISMEGVGVRAGGHVILESVDLEIASGSHVAIVGPSGAGKSSLVGLLLGWHSPTTGSVRVDGVGLDRHGLEKLRAETAWVDPAVQLWNRSLLENLRYGSLSEHQPPVGWAIEQAELRRVLERFPDGLQTGLGEGGALVSGGEGQRVRFGRAILRSSTRLVILDEPFRGLDRSQRRSLLNRARELWKDATLLCVTHDVGETQVFDRVVVVEAGRIIEEGLPSALAEREGSRYQQLLQTEESIRRGLWSSGGWRRLRLEEGLLAEAERSAGSRWTS